MIEDCLIIMEIISIEKEYRGLKRGTNTFYHYTSTEALINIIKNGTLRFTNCMFLNDEEEYNYIFNVFDSIVSENIEDDIHSFIESMKGRITRENQEILLPGGKLFLPLNEAFATYYVLCGSIEGDSIPLWNYYVKNGMHYGYALQMDTLEISKELTGIDGKFLFGKIIYDLDEQKSIIKNYIAYLNVKYSVNSEYFDDKAIDEYQCDFFDFIQAIRLFFKDKSFKHEDEFRIALLVRNSDTNVDKGYFARNGVITPYINIRFADRVPINKITVSKSVDENIGTLGLKDLLEYKSYNLDKVVIEKSNVKMRF